MNEMNSKVARPLRRYPFSKTETIRMMMIHFDKMGSPMKVDHSVINDSRSLSDSCCCILASTFLCCCVLLGIT